MIPLIRKELGHYFNNPFGYIVIVLFAVFANFMFVKDVFVVGTVSMRQFFNFLPWIAMIFVPAVTMRTLAEEKRSNTYEVLQTLPLTASQIVLGKFIAVLIVCAAALILTMGLPISLNILGSQAGSRLYLPEILTAYIGTLFFFGMGSAIGIFFSGTSNNQVVAFLISALVLFFLNVISTDVIGSFLPSAFDSVVSVLSPTNHLGNFVKGVLDVRSLFYFLSTMVIFLFLTIVDVEKRR